MEIKTIRKQLDYVEDFDKEVNAALADGWKLTKREVLVPPTDDKYIMAYAELEKRDEKPAVKVQDGDLLAAARLLHEHCMRHGGCTDCPLEAVSAATCSPSSWRFPEAAPEDEKEA